MLNCAPAAGSSIRNWKSKSPKSPPRCALDRQHHLAPPNHPAQRYLPQLIQWRSLKTCSICAWRFADRPMGGDITNIAARALFISSYTLRIPGVIEVGLRSKRPFALLWRPTLLRRRTTGFCIAAASQQRQRLYREQCKIRTQCAANLRSISI